MFCRNNIVADNMFCRVAWDQVVQNKPIKNKQTKQVPLGAQGSLDLISYEEKII
jgi:hypothetical protein